MSVVITIACRCPGLSTELSVIMDQDILLCMSYFPENWLYGIGLSLMFKAIGIEAVKSTNSTNNLIGLCNFYQMCLSNNAYLIHF